MHETTCGGRARTTTNRSFATSAVVCSGQACVGDVCWLCLWALGQASTTVHTRLQVRKFATLPRPLHFACRDSHNTQPVRKGKPASNRPDLAGVLISRESGASGGHGGPNSDRHRTDRPQLSLTSWCFGFDIGRAWARCSPRAGRPDPRVSADGDGVACRCVLLDA
jgi:hypothetical protein